MSITINGSGDINATGNDIELNSTGTTDVTLALGGGNVGIGDSNPFQWSSVQPSLNLRGSSASFPNRSGALIFKSQSGTYMTVMDFETGNDLRWYQSSDSGSSWSERMKLNSSGNLVFPNGQGIVFADAGASGSPSPTASSNTFDSYEEGTFSPKYVGSSSDPTISYSYQFGRYVKVGNLVWIFVRISTSSVSGGSGSLRVGNLPFSCSSNSNDYHSFNLSYTTGFATNKHPSGGYTYPNTNFIQLIRFNGTEAYGPRSTAIDITEMSSGVSNNYIILSGVYSTA